MLMRCHWLQRNGSWLTEVEVTGDASSACVVWHCSPCTAQEERQESQEWLSLPEPSHLLPAELFLPTCSGKKFPHVFGVKHSHRVLPILWHHVSVRGQGTVTGSLSQPLFPCTQPICPQVSLKHLFVPSLAARLKSSYHRQRKRNILQVCNSLKHWTCSNISLPLGRKEDMFRLWSTMTHL